MSYRAVSYLFISETLYSITLCV